MTSGRLPKRATSAPATAWLASRPSIAQSRARPSAPSPRPVRSWIAGRREKIVANIAPLRAKTTVTAMRACRAGDMPREGRDARATAA